MPEPAAAPGPAAGSGLPGVVFALLLVATTVMLLLPADQLTTRGPDDKVGHAVTFTVLAVAGTAARVRPLPLLLGLTAYAGATEVLQGVLPVNRHGDPLDLAADVVGVLVGIGLAALAGRLSARQGRGRTRG